MKEMREVVYSKGKGSAAGLNGELGDNLSIIDKMDGLLVTIRQCWWE